MAKEKSKLTKNLHVLVLLVVAGFSAYLLPYFRYYYYDAFVALYQINNTQMGLLGTAYGVLAMIAYFFGGFVADRFPARKLLMLSLVSTGLLGFIMLAPIGYIGVLIIHGLWGISTILTFWPALMKAIRMLADEKEQSKAYGFFEGGRGIANAVVMTAILGLFSLVAGRSGDIAGLRTILTVYSVLNVVVGILCFLLLKDDVAECSSKFDWEGTKKVLKMPHTWMIVIIMFCSYSLNNGFYLVTPYATSTFGSSAVFAAALSILAQWVRPVGSICAGFLGDRTGPSKVMLLGFGLMLAGEVLLVVLPGSASMIPLLIIACVLMYLSMYVCQSMHYALMSEADYPLSISGTAVGIIATLGYMPEWAIPAVGGRCLDTWEGAAGYRIYFCILIGLALIGAITTLIWLRITKEKRAELAAKKTA